MAKNILICNDSLGIGGVETAIYMQATALKNMGNNVVVVAKKRNIYRKNRSTRNKIYRF